MSEHPVGKAVLEAMEAAHSRGKAEGVREGLERAAKWLEDEGRKCFALSGGPSGRIAWKCGDEFAAGIRRLAAEQGEGGGG